MQCAGVSTQVKGASGDQSREPRQIERTWKNSEGRLIKQGKKRSDSALFALIGSAGQNYAELGMGAGDLVEQISQLGQGKLAAILRSTGTDMNVGPSGMEGVCNLGPNRMGNLYSEFRTSPRNPGFFRAGPALKVPGFSPIGVIDDVGEKKSPVGRTAVARPPPEASTRSGEKGEQAGAIRAHKIDHGVKFFTPELPASSPILPQFRIFERTGIAPNAIDPRCEVQNRFHLVCNHHGEFSMGIRLPNGPSRGQEVNRVAKKTEIQDQHLAGMPGVGKKGRSAFDHVFPHARGLRHS